MIDWLLNNGSVLDGAAIANIFVLCIVVELFGIASYWLRRFG